MNRCKCGCNGVVKPGRSFIHGHTNKGKRFSDDHKQKISRSCMGRKFSRETRRKLSEANRGKTLSKETRRKISEGNKGKEVSKETRRKISKSQEGNTNSKGYKHTEEARRKIGLANSKILKGRRLPEDVRLKIAIGQMKCRTDGYCDEWSDMEYKEDLRADTCGNCGMTVGECLLKYNQRLSLHHRDGDKKNCRPGNFDTLCVSCHAYADWELRRRGKVGIT